jgi:hypothetical protein
LRLWLVLAVLFPLTADARPPWELKKNLDKCRTKYNHGAHACARAAEMYFSGMPGLRPNPRKACAVLSQGALHVDYACSQTPLGREPGPRHCVAGERYFETFEQYGCEDKDGQVRIAQQAMRAAERQRNERWCQESKTPASCAPYWWNLLLAGERVEEVVALARAGCTARDDASCAVVADAYAHGWGVPQDPARAAALRSAWCAEPHQQESLACGFRYHREISALSTRSAVWADYVGQLRLQTVGHPAVSIRDQVLDHPASRVPAGAEVQLVAGPPTRRDSITFKDVPNERAMRMTVRMFDGKWRVVPTSVKQYQGLQLIREDGSKFQARLFTEVPIPTVQRPEALESYFGTTRLMPVVAPSYLTPGWHGDVLEVPMGDGRLGVWTSLTMARAVNTGGELAVCYSLDLCDQLSRVTLSIVTEVPQEKSAEWLADLSALQEAILFAYSRATMDAERGVR